MYELSPLSEDVESTCNRFEKNTILIEIIEPISVNNSSWHMDCSWGKQLILKFSQPILEWKWCFLGSVQINLSLIMKIITHLPKSYACFQCEISEFRLKMINLPSNEILLLPNRVASLPIFSPLVFWMFIYYQNKYVNLTYSEIFKIVKHTSTNFFLESRFIWKNRDNNL